jgi:predicted membrane-bound spermidine synthase
MNLLSKKLRPFLWFLYPEQTLFEGVGLYSAVRVTKRGDRLNLYTGKDYLQTSVNTQVNPHGSIFDWFLAAPWFSGNFEGSLESLLVLGLGGGVQVKSYNQIYKVKSITGVEIDPLIIDLGKKYFDLNDANLKTINEDACLFLDTATEIYSLIILDLFKKDIFEKNCQSSSFFHKVCDHLTSEGVLLVNKVLGDPFNQEMTGELKKVFNTVITLRIYKNMFFIATNSPMSPKSSVEARQLLLKALESNRVLRFFRSIKLKDIEVL